jgi:hypothetical protein
MKRLISAALFILASEVAMPLSTTIDVNHYDAGIKSNDYLVFKSSAGDVTTLVSRVPVNMPNQIHQEDALFPVKLKRLCRVAVR